jgi:hypothetical protein
VARTPTGNVYAGADGNVYRHTDNGWSKWNDGGWQSMQRPTNGGGSRSTLNNDGYRQLEQDRFARFQGGGREFSGAGGGRFAGGERFRR